MTERRTSDYLPSSLPHGGKRVYRRITDFGGIGRLGGDTAGVVADMVNLSPRMAPALAVRHPRSLFMTARDSTTAHGMAMLGNVLYFVQGSTLYASTEELVATAVGTVSDTDKLFAVFGDRLIILPDKVYVDAADGALHPMELDTGEIDSIEFSLDTVTLPKGMTWTSLGFEAGDGIYVLNADDVTPAPEGQYGIARIQGRVAYLTSGISTEYVSRARIKRLVPDMDSLCVCGERLYGCRGKDIYISASGSALNWNGTGTSTATASLTLHTRTEGNFTACAPWQGYVVFFKPGRICKLLGSRTDSFTLNDTPAPGIPAALAGTLCEVGGALYYHGLSAVYRYAGQYPERVGHLTNAVVTAGCGGTDGLSYYVAVSTGIGMTGSWRQYVYAPDAGAWYAEDALHPVAMLYREGFLCTQDHTGRIWLSASDGRRAETSFAETPLYGHLLAAVTFESDHSFEPEGYRPVNLFIRATAVDGAEMRVLAAFADGLIPQDATSAKAVELGHITGAMNDRLVRIPLHPRRCDSVRLRLELTGSWVIHAVTWEYERSE